MICQFYPFNFYCLIFVLLHSYVDNATQCVEISHNSFGEMEFNRRVLEWPPVVFELLVWTLTETTDVAVC